MKVFLFDEDSKNMKHKFKSSRSAVLFLYICFRRQTYFYTYVLGENLCLNSSGKTDIYTIKRFKFCADTW